ncbi:MAG: hypothetical protein C4326_15285 [Ignavibacteria bacterium]
MKHVVWFALASCLFALTASAQESYFYKKRMYGSEALFNPLSLVLNASFDIIQLDGHSRAFKSIRYAEGFSNVLRNITRPFGPISRYGWGNFVADQILPLHLTRKDAQWWPNYQLHLIGGGMNYTMLREWYHVYGVPSPSLFAIGTLAVKALLNEAIENGAVSGDNVDPIADLLIFDPAGIVLFSFEGVNEFFSKELNLADWSLQPSLTFAPAALHNNGQYFSIKWRFPFSERWHLFYYFGMNGLIGLSYKLPDGRAISLGGGLRAKQLVLVNAATNKQTLDLVWNIGAFYDKDNSLMASLFVSGLTDYTVSANLYPGIIDLGGFTPGVWIVVARGGKLLAGITTVWAPGLGIKTE